MCHQIEQNGQEFSIFDAIGEVRGEAFEVAGYAGHADALGDRAALAGHLTLGEPVEQRGARRVGQGDLHRRVAFAQEGADASQSAAAADGADEGIDLAEGLFPDFGGGAFIVGGAVGDVVELIGPEGAVGLGRVQLARHCFGVVDEVVGAGEGGGVHLDQPRAQGADGQLLLFGLGARHDDDHAVAQGRADQGQTDASIARCAFHDDPAGLQRARGLGLLHDGQGGAVLDGLAGVQELSLAQNLAAGGVRQAVQADERRVADEVDDAGDGQGVSLGLVLGRGRRWGNARQQAGASACSWMPHSVFS